jgi:hypothetical protein
MSGWARRGVLPSRCRSEQGLDADQMTIGLDKGRAAFRHTEPAEIGATTAGSNQLVKASGISSGRDERKTCAISFRGGSAPSLGDVVCDAGVLLRPWVQAPRARPARRHVTRSWILHHHISGTARQ